MSKLEDAHAVLERYGYKAEAEAVAKAGLELSSLRLQVESLSKPAADSGTPGIEPAGERDTRPPEESGIWPGPPVNSEPV